ncbi:hypothetical protein [Paenibacillus sp. BK720]|uniref:hypothetical protein n=1 Tax=Paenibacillus sp. BK720 TaxID=2587092 RepID=UPI00141E4889|nr:hypothetical protein [Paenibacillus sp. BK720]NIK68133.1 hypothetical protein [Paenibacillus sp. BK720]
MKHSRSVFVPAVVVAMAGFALIFHAWFGVSRQGLPGIKPGDRGNEELFKTLGTIAVWSTALSYAWLRVKRKRKSPSPLVKKLVKLFDKAHRLAGYAAIVLIAVHGLYFLTQARIKDDTYTGIAGFALLLSLGVYGFLIRRV